MQILRIWIIAGNGLQLINANIHCQNGEYTINAELFQNGENLAKSNMQAAGIWSFLHFFDEMLIHKPCSHMLFEDILLVFHYWQYHFFQPEHTIRYTIIAVAKLDLTLPIEDQSRVLRNLCQLVGWEFYEKHHNDLDGIVVNLQKLEPFKNKCEELAQLEVNEIDKRLEEFKKKLGLINDV